MRMKALGLESIGVSLRHVKSEMFTRHPSGDIKQRVNHKSKVQEKVQVRDKNSGVGNYYILNILLKQLPTTENNKVFLKNKNKKKS